MRKINLSQLNWRDFHYWPRPIKFTLIFFSGFLVLIINYCLVFNSLTLQYKNHLNEEIEQKKQFEKIHQAANLKAYQNQLEKVKKIYQRKIKKFVKENERSAFLNKIANAGVSSGLIIDFFAPDLEENNLKQKKFFFKMEVIGDYHHLVSFLTKIFSFKKLIVLTKFELLKEERTKYLKNNLLLLKFSANFYQNYEL
ncbi:MAG: type 4a pilus biogenesis protein PilO [Tatlockia sp.]|nr:type 4a pilus biogenesis protein PilO [Tatlockia sp.]